MVGVEAGDEMRGHGGRGGEGDGEVVKVMLADVYLSCLVFLHHRVYFLCLNFSCLLTKPGNSDGTPIDRTAYGE
jgi:hypothetical protein